MSATLNLVSELERIVAALVSDAHPVSQVLLTSVAERIARSMGVKKEEVAILGVSTRWKHLHFILPESLKNVGFIPLSSTSALAARTARESRPEIENSFAIVPHAAVFESAKANPHSSEAIQKIISAPILAGGKVVGVIQISRKGGSAASAGPDFTADDLGKVLALCKPLGKLLVHITKE